jgi:hypothetical protein
MRYFVGILAFIFLAPVCIIAGFFSTCLFAGMAGDSVLMPVLLVAGPLFGLAGSVALAVLIVRSMKHEPR